MTDTTGSLSNEERKQLEQEIAERYEKLHRDDAARRRVARANLVGTCYREQNSYGLGTPVHWWVYRLVTGINEHGFVEMFEFEQASDGRVAIQTKHSVFRNSDLGEPITREAFGAAWRDLVGEISRLEPVLEPEGA